MSKREEILNIRTSTHKKSFSKKFERDKSLFKILLKSVFELEEYPYKEYASWILLHLIKESPTMYQYLYPQLVDVLFKTNDQTVLRNVTCSLVQLNLTSYRETELIDLLIRFIEDHNNKVALHVYSIDLLNKICVIHPELKTEISSFIDLHSEGKSAAFHVASRRFQKNNKK